MEKVVTKDHVSDAAVRDMIMASICKKHTHSISVGFAKDGIVVGVGDGQQSSADCVKLQTWMLR